MVVVLLGPPGVGKGTQAVLLTDHLGGEHISTGDLLRAARRDGTPLGTKAQEFMDAGELVPDDLILDLVRERLTGVAPEAAIFFDGFPRTIPQAEGLDRVLAEEGRRVDRVVLFEAEENALIQRLSGRRSCPSCGAVFNVFTSPPAEPGTCDRCGGELVHRRDDDEDTVVRRLEVYQEQTAPLVDFYRGHDTDLVVVDGDGTVAEVQGRFRAVLTGRAV